MKQVQRKWVFHPHPGLSLGPLRVIFWIHLSYRRPLKPGPRLVVFPGILLGGVEIPTQFCGGLFHQTMKNKDPVIKKHPSISWKV